MMFKSLRLLYLPVLALIVTTACQPLVKQQDSKLNTGLVISLEEASQLQPGTITVVAGDRIQDNSGTAIANLQADLEKSLPQCASGPNTVDLHVRVDNFLSVDGVTTVLLGGQISLDALVELRNPTDNRLMGEYYMSVFDGGGGLLALAKLAGADKKLPKAIASSICEQVFGVKLPEEKPTKQPAPLHS